MKKIKDLLEKQRRLYHTQIQAVQERRNLFPPFSKRAKEFFQRVLIDFQEAPFFDKLYIDEGSFPLVETKNRNTITLRFGYHQTGISVTEYHQDGGLKSAKAEIERGGALHYTQSANGQVVCIIYGCKSDLLKPKDERFVFKRYKHPADIDEKELMRATKAFFWYARITSFTTGFSIWDTYRLDFYKIRSFTSKPDWNAIVGVIGAIASILYIISFIV